MKTSKQMAEEVYNIPFCRRCRKPLTKKQLEKARKKRFGSTSLTVVTVPPLSRPIALSSE